MSNIYVPSLPGWTNVACVSTRQSVFLVSLLLPFLDTLFQRMAFVLLQSAWRPFAPSLGLSLRSSFVSTSACLTFIIVFSNRALIFFDPSPLSSAPSTEAVLQKWTGLMKLRLLLKLPKKHSLPVSYTHLTLPTSDLV